MPDFQWTQVVVLCGLFAFLGYWLAISRWRGRGHIKPPEQLEPGKKFPRSHDTPSIRVWEEQFHQGRLAFRDSLELANTYRRKGDIQAAIEIHQSLYGRPSLGWKDQQEAQFELAMDFFQAGILGRAEDLLRSLVSQNGPYTAEVVRLLLNIYRQEQDWEAAIQLFRRHESLAGKDLQWEHVHVLCEQAEALGSNQRARELVREAQQIKTSSLRPPLILMQFAIQDRRWKEFRRLLQGVVSQEIVRTDLLRPILTDVVRRHPSEVLAIMKVLRQHNQQPDVRLLHGELLCDTGQPEQGIQLIRSVPLNPVTLRFRLENLADKLESAELSLLAEDVVKHQSQQTHYQCRQCGYESHGHHWHCPQCSHWESLAPSGRQNSKLLI
ncbi:MAG: hypothetical protein WED11_01280 [Natronospirillum sp.]